MKHKKFLKKILSLTLTACILTSFFCTAVGASENANDEYELRVLTFEDEGENGYWSSLIPSDQYSDPILYGDIRDSSKAYTWCDKGNTMLSHTIPYNYGSYSYWGGGHAISDYATGDFETYGDYMSQLTVFADVDPDEGIVRLGGGNNGSKNFAIHFGYADDSGFNGIENLPSISFADKKARVIDHMYVNVTSYALCCYLNGNGFTEGLGENDTVEIVATGYNGSKQTGSSTFQLVNNAENIYVFEWTPWDLSELGAVTKVEFNMTGSSDNGFGFSQPAYFAYDDVAVRFENPTVGDVCIAKAQSGIGYDCIFTVDAPEIDSGKAIVALYSGNALSGIHIHDIENGKNDINTNVITTQIPDRYTIMLSDTIASLRPLCRAVSGEIR